ncbi:flavodoxin I [Lentibacillus persicus]|uniref:Flavodoxin I n=1 Tax=Lentibacillus persicus TaxID=640948 RepID=A0A1I2AZ76_9BACI|nr:flavodoxin domain-containing protein [Lentibacillus persicus]SFE48958.1 flavodoxin I [Lentibacillus persicus]
MGNVLLAYVSMTGNTEAIAEIMKETVEVHGHNVVTKTFEMEIIDIDELPGYDGILAGTYSWDDGTLPFEVEDFYEDLEEANITGMPVGVFGSGESFYPTFGGAANLLGDRFEERQANLMSERLIVELAPRGDDILRCQAFAERFCKMIESKTD